MIPTTNVPDDPSDRPFSYSSIFWWGMFDKNSEGSRYMRQRLLVGFAIVLAGIPLAALVSRLGSSDLAKLAPAALGLAGAVWIATGFTRYMRYLDEMQRQLHYESIAITYAVVMAVAIFAGAVQMPFEWDFNPLYLVLAEPIRGVVLAFVTRRRA